MGGFFFEVFHCVPDLAEEFAAGVAGRGGEGGLRTVARGGEGCGVFPLLVCGLGVRGSGGGGGGGAGVLGVAGGGLGELGFEFGEGGVEGHRDGWVSRWRWCYCVWPRGFNKELQASERLGLSVRKCVCGTSQFGYGLVGFLLVIDSRSCCRV